MSNEFSVQPVASHPSSEEPKEASNKGKPLTVDEKRDIQRIVSLLDLAGKGDFASVMSSIHEIRTSKMRKEIQMMVEMAQEYGPIETAADSLISSLRTAQAADENQRIELNDHMKEFIRRARIENPPLSDSTENALNKLESGEKISGAEASDLLAYLEESKEKVIPQGKRAATLTQQIKGLQDRYEQETRDAGSQNRAVV